MARTTATAIREIMNTKATEPQIVAFITDASLWITEEVATFLPTPSAERLEIIERYLSCALVRLRELGLSQSTVENVTEYYQVDPQVTDYLLRAAAFDPSGKIRRIFLAPKPQSAPTPIIYPALFGIGTGFKDESL